MIVHPTLPGLQIAMADLKSQALGRQAEAYVRLLLEASGYNAIITRPDEAGDLRATDPATGLTWVIEVKAARRASDKRWHFTLWKKNHTDHHLSDMVILLAVTPSAHVVPFVIPAAAVQQRSAIVISSDPAQYSGKFACYRQSISNLQLESNYLEKAHA
jgi:hypothetical protein